MRVVVGRAQDPGNKDYFSMPYKRSRLIYIKVQDGNLINHCDQPHLFIFIRYSVRARLGLESKAQESVAEGRTSDVNEECMIVYLLSTQRELTSDGS